MAIQAAAGQGRGACPPARLQHPLPRQEEDELGGLAEL